MINCNYVLAVDGGGTKSLAVVYKIGKGVIGIGQSGGSNFQTVGIYESTRAIEAALKEASAHNIQNYLCATFAMAGIDTEKDEKIVKEMIYEVMKNLNIKADKIIVKNDGEATLLGTLRGEAGILIISGTGSIIVACDGEGNIYRVGGWGHRLEDEGSAFYIGKKALVTAFHTVDGRKNADSLLKSILAELNLKTISELKEWVYEKNRTAADVAALAPLVIKLAEKGDPSSKIILDEAIEELLFSAITAYKRVLKPKKNFSIVLQGGLFQYSIFFRKVFINRLRQVLPNADIREPKYKPVVGALYLAMKDVGFDGSKFFDELEKHPILLFQN